jgi:hypothetical protein
MSIKPVKSVKRCLRKVLIPTRPSTIKKSNVDAAFEKIKKIGYFVRKAHKKKSNTKETIYLRGMY